MSAIRRQPAITTGTDERGSGTESPGAAYPPPGVLHRVDRRFQAEPASVAGARRLVVSAVAGWGLDSLADDLRLAVSELVTNAVLACTALGRRPTDTYGGDVAVRVTDTGGEVVAEVWDPHPDLPAVRDCGDDAEDGRGLPLVDALGTRGHYRPRAPLPGKVVWVALTRPTSTYSQDPLPRRPRRPVYEPAETVLRPADRSVLRDLVELLRDQDSWLATGNTASAKPSR